ncbi:MAG: 2-oxo acid dehydrogenase subunit E2 [Alphaproteobacteria bacterium]
MATNILMPALSPTMTEGKLAKWLVKEGDAVRSGDLIAEIETDKATMEVEAVDEGTVAKLLVTEGAEGVAVNAVIAVLADDGEDVGAIEAPAASAAPVTTEATATPTAQSPTVTSGDVKATPLAKRIAAQAGVSLDAVAATGAHGKVTKADVLKAAGAGGASGGVTAAQGDRVFASPLARRLAAEGGLPIERISGTGPNGRVIKADVERAVRKGLPAVAEEPAKAAAPGAAQSGDDYELVPHTSMRKTIARRLTESKQTVPHFYLTVDCEIDELLRVRKEINARAPEGVKVSVNDFVIKAMAVALRRVPAANASWTDEGIRLFKSVDVSVAVAIDGGLITPVVRDADKKGFAAISADMKDLAKRAREGKLKPSEYQGGTTSVSNLGMFGIKQFDAVINPPQGTILAVGAGEQRAVVKDGALAVATVMSCTLSCDHRVVDGALGAELLQAYKSLIEFPAAMLL